MPDEIVTVLENGRVNGRYFKMVFRAKGLSHKVLPGQFLEIKVREGCDPLLRRPMSYYRVTGNRVEILYETLGRGTQILAGLKKGDSLRILGPLGREFSGLINGKKRILIGGGVGVPPLVFLAERHGCYRFFIGTKSKKEVLPAREIAKFRSRIFFTTEDGSYGRKGLVTDLLEEFLEREVKDPEEYFIQTCGPNRMMHRVLEIASKYGVEGEASWDERMACGIGVCLGCMIWTHRGWTPSCTEGPVFRFDEIPEGHLWTAE